MHKSGGLIVSRSWRVAGRDGWLFVDRAALVGAGLVAHRYSYSTRLGSEPRPRRITKGQLPNGEGLTSRNMSESLASVPAQRRYFAAFGF